MRGGVDPIVVRRECLSGPGCQLPLATASKRECGCVYEIPCQPECQCVSVVYLEDSDS